MLLHDIMYILFSRGSRGTIALSVVQKTSPVLISPTKTRARPPAYYTGAGQTYANENTDDVYDFIPEPDYSPPNTPPGNGVAQPLQRDQQSSGVYKTRISHNSSQDADGEDPRTSGLYTRVIKRDSERNQPAARESGQYTRQIRPAPGAINVMPITNEFPKLRRSGSKDDTVESDATSPTGNNLRKSAVDDTYDDCQILSVKQIQEQYEQTYVNKSPRSPSPTKPQADRAPAQISPRDKKPAPLPPTQIVQTNQSSTKPGQPPPPPNAPAAPAPPPLYINAGRPAARGHLKQVHWSRTPRPLVRKSHTTKISLRNILIFYAVI